MIAAGSLASISATGIECGTISEYTLASRTRRAISWAYWAPKSTTRTGRGDVMGGSLPTGVRQPVFRVVGLHPLLVQPVGEPAGRVLHHPDVHHLGRGDTDRQRRTGAERVDDAEPRRGHGEAEVGGGPAGDR